MQELIATPYVPGQARGPLSRNPNEPGAIVILDSPALSPTAHPAGLIVIDGAPFSHPMLALLARGIPTVITTAADAANLKEGELVQLDGARGIVWSVQAFEPFAPAEPPLPPPGQPVYTADGEPILLRASVRNAAGAARARERGAEAIGLVRTEFIEPDDGRQPDAAFYQREFTALLAAAEPLHVTLRLLDIAADKRPAWLPRGHDCGPLGRQGVRLFDIEPVRSVVNAQLTALAAVGARERLRLLLPYITPAAEAKRWHTEIRAQLDVPIGVMIETPAAALDIGALLEVADFAALGTNDLMQCLFAADRDQPALRGYLDAYAPLLYRFLADVARAAGPRLPQLQVCGLLSQLPGVLPVLLGLGYRAFSVDAVFLPYLAAAVQRSRIDAARGLAEEVCRAEGSGAVRSRLRASVQALARGAGHCG